MTEVQEEYLDSISAFLLEKVAGLGVDNFVLRLDSESDMEAAMKYFSRPEWTEHGFPVVVRMISDA